MQIVRFKVRKSQNCQNIALLKQSIALEMPLCFGDSKFRFTEQFEKIFPFFDRWVRGQKQLKMTLYNTVAL